MEASKLQSVLRLLQLNDYGSLAIAMIVSYDFCLVFSKEVTYIWQRPWTMVSTLYLFVRYMGCLTALVGAFGGSTFIPGPVKVALYVLSIWTSTIFWMCADLVMILRVYAMYNRSRIILGFLLAMYIADVIVLLAGSGVYSDPSYAKVFIVHILDITVCNLVIGTQTWDNAVVFLHFILGAVLCIFAVAQFARESFQMHRATQTWQLNRYVRLLVRDGLLYFFVTLIHSLVLLVANLGTFPQGWSAQLLLVIAYAPAYSLTPRFIINVRELYVLDVQGRRGRDIDTGFGLSSGVGRAAGGLKSMSAMEFVEGGGVGAADADNGEIVEEEREGGAAAAGVQQ